MLGAHRVILSACSPYFHKLLSNPGLHRYGHHPVLVLSREVSEQDVKDILAFIYTGKVNLPRSRLPAFLKAAEALKIKGLAYSDSGGGGGDGMVAGQTVKKRSGDGCKAAASSMKENLSTPSAAAAATGSKRPAPATVRLSNASDGAGSESEQPPGKFVRDIGGGQSTALERLLKIKILFP